MKVVIAGGGRIGSGLARVLINEKHEVVVIENDENKAEMLGNELDALVLKGDATNRKVIKDANIDEADMAVAATGDDKTNLLISQIAMRYGVKKALARVTEPENYDLFLDLNITPVNETQAIVNDIKNSLSSANKHKILASICDDQVAIARATVGPDSKLNDQRLEDSALNRKIICVYRNGEVVLPDHKTTLKQGDIVYFTCLAGEQGNIARTIHGE